MATPSIDVIYASQVTDEANIIALQEQLVSTQSALADLQAAVAAQSSSGFPPLSIVDAGTIGVSILTLLALVWGLRVLRQFLASS